jgi:hypothetical protein
MIRSMASGSPNWKSRFRFYGPCETSRPLLARGLRGVRGDRTVRAARCDSAANSDQAVSLDRGKDPFRFRNQLADQRPVHATARASGSREVGSPDVVRAAAPRDAGHASDAAVSRIHRAADSFGVSRRHHGEPGEGHRGRSGSGGCPLPVSSGGPAKAAGNFELGSLDQHAAAATGDDQDHRQLRAAHECLQMRGDAASGFPVSDSAGLYRDPVRAVGGTAGSERAIRFRPAVGSDHAVGSNNAVGARDAVSSNKAVTPGNAVGRYTAIGSRNAVGSNNALGAPDAVSSGNAVGPHIAIRSYAAVNPNLTQVAETLAGFGLYCMEPFGKLSRRGNREIAASAQCVKAKSFNPISSLPGMLNPNFPCTDPSGKSHLSIATH